MYKCGVESSVSFSKAFELAHVLGISCPLTPSAMISATVPDKLLVSSLLFNMHQYFTRALPSAIAKDSTENGMVYIRIGLHISLQSL